MSINFDDIHTEKKQVLLHKMMQTVTAEIHQLDRGAKTDKKTACPICGHGGISQFAEKYGF